MWGRVAEVGSGCGGGVVGIFGFGGFWRTLFGSNGGFHPCIHLSCLYEEANPD